MKKWVKEQSVPTFKKFLLKEDSVIEYLEMLKKTQNMKGTAYSGPADFILKHGKQYESAELTPEEMDILKDVLDGQCRYKAKQCFYNAQSIGLGGTIGYVEGVADSIGLPMPHAWNTINGKVIDMTWKMNNDNQPVVGIIPEGWEYFGVKLPNKMINKMWSTGQSNAMIDDWESGFPLLQQVFEEGLSGVIPPHVKSAKQDKECKKQWHEWEGLCHYMITDGVTVGKDETDTVSGQLVGSQIYWGLPKMPKELKEDETITIASITGPKFSYKHSDPREGTSCWKYAQGVIEYIHQMRNEYNDH